MRLERGPEPGLALELRARRRELLAGVLEDSLARTPLLADRLAALVRPVPPGPRAGGAGRGRPRGRATPASGIDDEPALLRQVGFDREPDRWSAAGSRSASDAIVAADARRPGVGLPDGPHRRASPSTTRTIGGSPSAMIGRRPVGDHPGRSWRAPIQSESRSPSTRRREQRLAQVERDGPLLEAAQGRSAAGTPRDTRDRPPGRGAGRGRSRSDRSSRSRSSRRPRPRRRGCRPAKSERRDGRRCSSRVRA